MKTNEERHDDIMSHCTETLRRRPAIKAEKLEVSIEYGTHDTIPWRVMVTWYISDKLHVACEYAGSYQDAMASACGEFDASINGRSDDARNGEKSEEPVVELTNDTPIGAIIENNGKRYRLAGKFSPDSGRNGQCLGCNLYEAGCPRRASDRCRDEPRCIFVEVKEVSG